MQYVPWCCGLWQPSHKTRSVGQREDGPAVHSGRSQLSAEVPVSHGLTRHGESLAVSGSKRRPASTQSSSQTQQSASASSSELHVASQQLPPSGKQRLICSVDIPGIGRAAKVTTFNTLTLCKR